MSLAGSFNSMLARVNQLIDQLYRTELMEQRAELAALESQINPHFLYNTLSTITWAAREAHAPVVEELALSLSKFYRLSLNKGQPFLKIRDELTLLRAYITIQTIRFGDRLDVHIQAADDLLDLWMPKSLLQPLVENAIVHGIEPSGRGGAVWIVGSRQEGVVRWQVRDDGVGMDPDQVAKVNHGQLESAKVSGFAVKNVNERIRLRFGQAFGVELSSIPGEGTTSTLNLPVVENPE
jgi:two-component system sensor histidine kinase YesM